MFLAMGTIERLFAQGPADTKTELQIFCLFRSSAENTLHGSLVEIDERLHGLLGQIRKPEILGGEFGEMIVLTPPQGTLGAKRVLMIGLGDSASFAPARMYLVGKIAMREANRLGVAYPFFAPTVLDGGVSNFSTGMWRSRLRAGFVMGWRVRRCWERRVRAGGLRLSALLFWPARRMSRIRRLGLIALWGSELYRRRDVGGLNFCRRWLGRREGRCGSRGRGCR
jgi:Cytosol aminopeptidase family, N-terminal domain